MKIKAFAFIRAQERFASRSPLMKGKERGWGFKKAIFKKAETKSVFSFKLLIFFSLILCLPAATTKAQRPSEEEKAQKLEAWAQKNAFEAQKLEGVANKTTSDLENLRAQLIKTARLIQNQEEKLTDIEASLAVLEEEESRKGARRYHNRQRLSRVLSALQRIALQPTEALVVAPGDPLDTVRSAILLEYAVPGIEGRGAQLKQELDAMADIHLRIRDERASQITVGKELKRRRESLERLIEEKKRQQEKQLADIKDRRSRARKLEREASNIRELIRKLGTEEERKQKAQQQELAVLQPKPAETTTALVTDSPSPVIWPLDLNQLAGLPSRPSRLLLFPARGPITKNFGQTKDDNTTLEKGVIIATRPQAQVIAPFDGKVVYAGSFRGYGKLIILEHRGKNEKSEYHSLIAGLKEITVSEDQQVLSGEPVGRMRFDKDNRPEIYFELRKAGQPVDPLPWFKL